MLQRCYKSYAKLILKTTLVQKGLLLEQLIEFPADKTLEVHKDMAIL